MIREATKDDLPRLVEMGLRFHRETDYRGHIAANAEQMAKLAEQVVATGGVLVSERNGQLVGMIGVVLFPHFMSGEMVAGEIFWWVEPEHRGEGLKLLKEAEKRAREKGARRIQMIAPTEQVAHVYRRLGYSEVETAYQKSL